MSDTNNTIARTYTSESVTEGHPDKVADLIADTVARLLESGKDPLQREPRPPG